MKKIPQRLLTDACITCMKKSKVCQTLKYTLGVLRNYQFLINTLANELLMIAYAQR